MSRAVENLANELAANLRSVSRTTARAAHDSVEPSPVKTVRQGTLDPSVVILLRHGLSPVTALLTLGLCLAVFDVAPSTAYAGLALVAVLLTKQCVRPPNFDQLIRAPNALHKAAARPCLEWFVVVGILMAFIALMKAEALFSSQVLLAWFLSTGIALGVAHLGSARAARWITRKSSRTQRHIVVGANDVGLELVQRMQSRACASEFMGFFDFRSPERIAAESHARLQGHAHDVAAFVREHRIHIVYIALPISSAARIQELLAQLRDTTASVYFVPDILSFDVVQPRLIEVNGMPALSVCETPLRGMSAVRKRVADLGLAVAALAVLWPVLALIALAVRFSSPGPILFKQRRYGLYGEEIAVFKFRSMTVCEDGSDVVQVTRNDRRITALGKFLRQTSLDELPQIFNVLLGQMSFVGPRPHAVAHNEQYRKLISGYMLRHKVRPGITGWAQVNGARGETATVEKMQQRIRYDLEYLRQWSLWLDLQIIARTCWMVLKRENAY